MSLKPFALLRLAVLLFVGVSVVGCDHGVPSPVDVAEPVPSPPQAGLAEPTMTQPAATPSPLPASEESTPKTTMRLVTWNIESEGADIEVIAQQLKEMQRFDLYGFTEVNPPDWPRVKDALGDGYIYWYSHSGWRDRTAYAISKSRFEVIKKYEMKDFEGKKLNPGRYRSPHVYELTDKVTGADLIVVLNHLARGNEKVRQEQAEGLRLWAQSINKPIVALGDYNFDYVFETGQGNPAFDRFTADGVWTWVKPEPLVDSNWFDGDGDGKDDYPGSILDFAFVAGQAKQWAPESTVIVRPGDFPDDETTSDHRPVTLTLTPPDSAR